MKKEGTVLFVSPKDRQCGVYQFGYNVGHTLTKSKRFNFMYVECSSYKELASFIRKYKPICIIYNYQGDVMPWIKARITANLKIPQIGLIHEVTQTYCDSIGNYLFDFHIAPDPTLILKNPIVYKTGRLLLKNNLKPKKPKIPTIGSFGFASPNKKFDILTKTVCKQFTRAIIRLNIPFAKFGDEDGRKAKVVIDRCLAIAKNYPGIKLEYSHRFLNNRELLNFLNSNSINIFLYSDKSKRGISSVIDYALSVKVPIGISSDTNMFRHISESSPSIILSDKNKIHNIISNGIKPLKEYYKEWDERNLIWDYERIVADAVMRLKGKKRYGFIVRSGINYLKKKVYGVPVSAINNWTVDIKDYKDLLLPKKTKLSYKPLDDSLTKAKYNSILDEEAKNLYKPTINFLYKSLPKWMKRKNSKANIQQAFVLDTIIRLIRKNHKSKILSVGCFEDTAYAALKTLGYEVSGIDPVINYDLETYITKPFVKKGMYDVVFSTSVIEHVKDDSLFLKNISYLVKIGGYIIVTCDYKNDYKPGDPIPGSDFRFYTKNHLLNLVSQTMNLRFVGDIKWDNSAPDFKWSKGKYSFASIVLKKI